MRRRELLYEENGHDYSKDYLTFTANSACQVKFTGKTPSGGSLNTLQYSINGGTWNTLTDDTYVSLESGNSIMFKGNCIPVNSSTGGIGTFASTGGTFNASGNVMSLLFGDNAEGQTDLTGYDYAFYSLFNGCTGIVSVENLILPATTLANYCYGYMFGYCSSLTTAPELPATTLKGNCYLYMFYFCSSLTTAPELPATTLISGCYRGMFASCSSLNYIKAMFTTTPSIFNASGWVIDVASTGTFVKNSAATWNVTGTNGVPSGWTVEYASS